MYFPLYIFPDNASQVQGIKVERSIEFSYQELSSATQGFSMEHQIGQGGYGSVYYAELRGEVSSPFSQYRHKYDYLDVRKQY
jgi:putative alpha-1,2-mannosidase